MDNRIKELTIGTLFSGDEYVIPIYQRNYAWGEREVTQLIQDIWDYSNQKPGSNYYIGTLVTYERNNSGKILYETIDGQQRLTTLNILLSALKNGKGHREIETLKNWNHLNLEFDSRKLSTNTLKSIQSGVSFKDERYNTAICQAYEDARKALRKIASEASDAIDKFFHYLWNKVIILRVSVPADTDLNHYFEIMNNRGEQLEKHEILKANCLEVIKEDEQLSYTFNLIWESCANMERYVQYGFTVDQRNQIFGQQDWDQLRYRNIDELSAVLNKQAGLKQGGEILFLKDILRIKPVNTTVKEGAEEATERFNSVINFSNFLLHVLRVQTKADVPLDDKRLIDLFQPYLKTNDRSAAFSFVKQFGFNLLKCKFLFDKYIIKRDFSNGGNRWSLKRMKRYEGSNVNYVNSFGDENGNEDENRTLLMLLAMFHVSTPTMVYKHWLNAALKYVFENEYISSAGYMDYLENLAKAFLFDRFLAVSPLDYFQIIYLNNGLSLNKEIDEALLDKGTWVENFIFNYTDYLLWKNKELGYDKFEYTFRSSVEHYYPQNPIEGNARIDSKHLDSFGNLCLISSSKNSRLSNYMPTAKMQHYNNNSIDSMKQRMMMQYTIWGVAEIEDHGGKMKKLLLEGHNMT